MPCRDICIIPFILGYRCLVWACFCCFRHTGNFYSTLSEQLESRRSVRGGWFENIYRDFTSTRDTFFILIALYETNVEKTSEYELRFIQRLKGCITHTGQVPWGFETHWYNGEVPLYKRDGVLVVDANAQYIIMLYRYYTNTNRDVETHPRKGMQALWLSAQRAWEWLTFYIQKNVFIEPVGASWAHSLVHNGEVLLTNIYITQAIRAMEMLSLYNRDEVQQLKFRKLHTAFLARLVPEIYKTQETLPRILAVYWNMTPHNFVASFNAQIAEEHVPLRLPGPLRPKSTWISHIKGNNDQFTNVDWPWVGFFWIVVLAKKGKKNEVRAWWTSYMEFHSPVTMYDMYSHQNKKPVLRAFLTAAPMHALTLAMQLAADDRSFDDDLL